MTRTETVDYADDGVQLHGHFAWDDGVTGPRPGVLVVHEAFGLEPHAKGRAERIAGELGYAALAVDVYGAMPKSREEGMAMAAAMRDDLPTLRRRIRAGLTALRGRPEVDGGRVAAIGYCFGGTGVLELARDGADVAAVVSFHGGLVTKRPATPGVVTAKVLSCVGADDPFIPPTTVRGFEAEMTAAGADWQSTLYGGVVHSFTNPAANLPGKAEYHAAADRRSWAAMCELLTEAFG